MITSIVAAVVIFSILIVIHEAGHFAVAKRMGVRVLRFSLGYPPRVWGFRHGETDYAIGATPLGGYVRMLGDEVSAEPSTETLQGYLEELRLDVLDAIQRSGWSARIGETGDAALKKFADQPEAEFAKQLGRPIKSDELVLLREIARTSGVKVAIEWLAENRPAALLEEYNQRAFPTQPLRSRFAIVLAGPAANILFAPILMTLLYMVGVPEVLPILRPVDKTTPAYVAGLREGDRVLAIDGTPVDAWEDFAQAVKSSDGKELNFSVTRQQAGGVTRLNIVVKPKKEVTDTGYGDKAPNWIIGVRPGPGAEITKRYGPVAAVAHGVSGTVRMAAMLGVGIAKIIQGATPVRQALGGPIMIAQMAGREVHQGFADVVMFMVSISLELGIINLLPVPLLDGGHLLFFIIEGIKGEPLKLRHREIAMQVGLFLLVILMAFVILNDLSRLIG
ncbi:MAG TPA: RIP metalloprotease RseP [Candidatus Binataceae bacterium]|nr:RIP metalloprotease RseP [Candidatus Binataceae bacterium]